MHQGYLDSPVDEAGNVLSPEDKDSRSVKDILQDEIGYVFAGVLEDAGVYKRTPDGLASFMRFIDAL